MTDEFVACFFLIDVEKYFYCPVPSTLFCFHAVSTFVLSRVPVSVYRFPASWK
jgi:hypothetical protein